MFTFNKKKNKKLRIDDAIVRLWLCFLFLEDWQVERAWRLEWKPLRTLYKTEQNYLYEYSQDKGDVLIKAFFDLLLWLVSRIRRRRRLSFFLETTAICIYYYDYYYFDRSRTMQHWIIKMADATHKIAKDSSKVEHQHSTVRWRNVFWQCGNEIRITLILIKPRSHTVIRSERGWKKLRQTLLQNLIVCILMRLLTIINNTPSTCLSDFLHFRKLRERSNSG